MTIPYQNSSEVAYSEYNILKDEMVGSPSSFKKVLFQTLFRPTLTIRIPKKVFIQMNNICEWVQRETKSFFNVKIMLEILIEDYIQYVRTNMNNLKMYEMLVQLKDSPLMISYYNDLEKTILLHKKLLNNDTSIKFKIRRADLLMLELLFQSIHEKYQTKFTVEECFCMLLVEFIERYNKGEANDVLDSIVNEYKTEEAEESEWIDMGGGYFSKEQGRVSYGYHYAKDMNGKI